jgi:glucose-6-phosphate 1-epimerase
VRCAAAADVGQDVDALNSKFGIPEHVTVKPGRGGLPMVQLQHTCGASAEVYLLGGVVTSWKMASGDEVLYVRPDAKFDGSKPISGGIPHCFPQFGPGEMQQHGFARNLDWTISSTSADLQPDDRDPQMELVLTDSEYTRKMWPHKFKAVYSVHLHGENLHTDLRIINEGDKPFTFTAALHSYFEVADIGKAKVHGLKGLTYLDKTKDANSPPEVQEEREAVDFTGPVDSVYLDAPGYVELDVGTGAAVGITSSEWNDVVVWSPWTDMDCYKSFCCVENAKFKPVTVQPGDDWRAQQTLEIKDL